MNPFVALTLADIMSRSVRHVLPECSLGEAARQMNEAHISSLLVMTDNMPLGILTERDLLRLLSTHADMSTPLAEIMSAPVLTASCKLGFTAAYARVLGHHVRHLAVVNDAGQVIGLASETDFRNHLGSGVLRQLHDLNAVMDKDLPQLSPDATLDQALALMLRDHSSFVLLVENACPVGILTERDMAGLLLIGRRAEEVFLRAVMHAPVLSVVYHTPVFEMAALMQARGLRHLVVVDDQQQLMGMVTLHKLLENIATGLLNEQSAHQIKTLESSRQHAESLLRTIVQTIPDPIWLKDVEGVYLSCNPMYERFIGVTETEMVGKTDYDFVSRELADSFRENDRRAIATGKPVVHEDWFTFADDGHCAYLEMVKSPMFDVAGRLIGVLGTARDLSERKIADDKIHRLTQLYAALSRCNQSIVRSTSEAELFSQICRDALLYGGIKVAWIGMADINTGMVKPVACSGAGVDNLSQISFDPASPYGLGPTGTAIRENRACWCQDITNDPAPWHDQVTKFGWGASAALPLLCNGIVVGALTLHAAEGGAFDEDARNLLLEMTSDISFALGNFEREAIRARLELQSENERLVLELLATGESLPVLLNHLALHLEVIFPGMLCSILLLSQDGQHLRHGAAPSLPDAYCKAIDGAAIGENAGSCGTAAHTRKMTIVPDIAHDPLWQDYKALALAHGLAACWSVPIFSTLGQVLGTLALYYSAPRHPLPIELASLERSAHLASLAIERARNEVWLNKLSQAVEQSPNTIVITDMDANIEYANAAFSKATGYQLSEALGKNPRILHSGKTSPATYEAMWAALKDGKVWRGELINRRRDGSEYIEYAIITPVRQTGGQVTNYLAIKEDITEKKLAEARIQQLAYYDLLTGLPNQTLLKERVGLAMQIAQRSSTQLAVLFLDLDHFKNVNDTLGHRIGDELLILLANRLKSLVRDEDTLSRLGGDEFILVLPGTDADGAAHVAKKVLETVAQTCLIGQYELVVTPSIGISIYPDDGADFDKLYQNADVAMYRAKQDGRNSFRFFTSEMQARAARCLQLENALRHALARNQFELYYQPQISMQDGRVVGVEALLRWNHPELGAVSPAEFIPVAEDSGLILPIGEWVLRSAALQAKNWMDRGLKPFTIAVNLSAVQFRHAHLSELVMKILDETGLPPQYIELELTESVAMDAPLAAIAVMDDLHACGIRMSIDDFGTGYSSLSYLRKFKVHKLKIDQSFIRDISEDPESRAIVTAIITLASSMGFQTIAEGVETAGQLAFLRLQGCHEVQGYYFSHPLAAAQLEIYLREYKRF